MFSEALFLSATGVMFVFFFLTLLVFTVKGMSFVSLHLDKTSAVHETKKEEKIPLEIQKKAALAAVSIHHKKINS